MTPPGEGPTAVELRIARTPPCTRCATPVALVVRYPHSWRNRAGERVGGFKEMALCASCDRGDPAARALLPLLAPHGEASEVRVDEAFGRLLLDWLDAVRTRVPNRSDLGAQEARWRTGTL
ncbi:DUF6300 family protein [Streptomyces sp. NPDC004752]